MSEDKDEVFVSEELKKDDDEEVVVPPVEEPSSSSSDSMIDRLNAAVERAEKANEVTANLLKQQQELRVKQVIGGVASAGSPGLSDDQKKDKAAKELLAGTGFDEELFPDA